MRNTQIRPKPMRALAGVRGPRMTSAAVCAMARARSVCRNRQRAADRAAQLDRRAHRNLLVLPRISDVGLEGDAAAEIDVVAQRVAEIRAERDLAFEMISLSA